MKPKTVLVDVPYKYNRSTGELEPVFGPEYEQELANRKLAQSEVDVILGDGTTSTNTTPQENRRIRYEQEIETIPVGGYKQIGGQYVYRTGAGPNDITILTVEEVRNLASELGTVGGP